MAKDAQKLSYVIALICFIIFSFLFYVGVFSNIQFKFSDNLYGGQTALNNIVIAAIDDKSLQEIGRWPWDREAFVELFKELNESAVVGVDVAFFEEYDKDVDEELAKVIKEKGNIIIPVEYMSYEREDGSLVGKDILLPVGDLKNSALGYGYVNVLTDDDGVTRAVNVGVQGDYDSFAYEVFKDYWKKNLNFAEDRFLINFVGKPGSFAYYSITDIINKRVDKEVFKNKLVLVGATAPDLHDDYFVPTSEGKAMPGVEIHANTIQTMILGKFLADEPAWLVILLIFVCCFLTAFLIERVNIWISSVVLLALLIFYIFLAIMIFNYGIIMNLVYFPLPMIGTFIPVLSFHYLGEKKRKKEILGAFGKYVSPVLINEILKDPDKLKLGGEKKLITIFFSDIRGFTSISEALTPEQLVHLLNEYLTEMADIVLKKKGLVDKYIGDAVMAFWGAPLDEPNQAVLACEASLDMMEKLGEMQKKWKKDSVPNIDIGIGLNTGNAVVGNMGSYERFDYTAMGDSVNLASRLEGLNKPYGTHIIISENTERIVRGKFVTRKLDLVKVKGKKLPVAIFELVGEKDKVEAKDKKWIKHFEEGLKLYFSKSWDKAAKEFDEVLKVKDDLSAKTFIERCKEYKKSPPPKDWDGSFEMKTK